MGLSQAPEAICSCSGLHRGQDPPLLFIRCAVVVQGNDRRTGYEVAFSDDADNLPLFWGAWGLRKNIAKMQSVRTCTFGFPAIVCYPAPPASILGCYLESINKMLICFYACLGRVHQFLCVVSQSLGVTKVHR